MWLLYTMTFLEIFTLSRFLPRVRQSDPNTYIYGKTLKIKVLHGIFHKNRSNLHLYLHEKKVVPIWPQISEKPDRVE